MQELYMKKLYKNPMRWCENVYPVENNVTETTDGNS
jgi:hypothetical protein